MFGTDRAALRRGFVEAWRKRLAGAPATPLEAMIADVIAAHPEYQAALSDPETLDERDFPPEAGEANPFLHMGMHLALREQVGTDRPAGIAGLHRRLSARTGDPHEAEHRMMECLGRALWEAQRGNRPPDEQSYLECLRRLAGSGGTQTAG
jgi:hypothetical protein